MLLIAATIECFGAAWRPVEYLLCRKQLCVSRRQCITILSVKVKMIMTGDHPHLSSITCVC